MKKLITFNILSMLFIVQVQSQNVGIGTIAPTDKLTVFTPNANYGLVHTDGNISIGTWVGNDAGYFGTRSAHDLRFFAGNSPVQMTLKANGYLGIGNANPQFKLDIHQDVPNRAIKFSHQSGFHYWTIGVADNYNCRFQLSGVAKAEISSADGAHITLSDLRLKEEITPLPGNILSKTMQLKPYSYFYNNSRNLAKNKSIGFLAQDVEKLFPEIVHDMQDGLKGLNYAAFGIIAIKAIQEQQQNIQQQQQEILDQKNVILNLQRRLLKLEMLLQDEKR